MRLMRSTLVTGSRWLLPLHQRRWHLCAVACPAFAWDRVTVSVRTVVLRWRHAKNIDEWRRRMVGRGFERKASAQAFEQSRDLEFTIV